MNHVDSSFDLNDPQLVSVIDELSLWSAPFGLKLLDAVRYQKSMTVLDIGFGTGFPLLELAMRLGSSSKIYGIDPWTEAVERTRRKIAVYGIINVELLDGVAESIPLPDGSVDLIVSNNGINNVNDLDKVLSECDRIGKPGAQFVATMNLDKTMVEFYQVMETVLRENGLVDEIEAMKKHIYFKRKPISEIKERFEMHHFNIDRVHEDVFEYKFANGTAMLNYHFIRLAFLDSWKNIVTEGIRGKVFSEIESRLNTIAESKGVFSMTVPFATIDARKI